MIAKNVRLLEIYNICMSALFIMPVFMPYYRDVIGLTFEDFLIGEAVFAAVVVALEVPSGWISDVWKRKNTLILSCCFWILGFGLLYVAENLLVTIIAQAVIGIAVSLYSGTTSALLYDTLLAANKQSEYSRLEGRRTGFGFYSIAITSIIGGFMYSIDPAFPMLATILATLPALICAILMTEPFRHKSAIQTHPAKDIALTLRYALHGHAEVAFIIIFAGLLFSGTKLLMWIQQPYYMQIGLPEYYFGILMAGGFLLGGASSQLGHKLDGRLSNIKTLSGSLMLAICVCLISAWQPGLHGVFFLMVGGTCIYGISMPRVNDAINRRVDSVRRATILSTVNLLRQLFFIPLGLIVGALTTAGGVEYGLFGITGWLVAAGMIIGGWAVLKTIRSRPALGLKK